MDSSQNRLDLLLAYDDKDDRRPVLEDGLPDEAAQNARRPKKGAFGDKIFRHKDPNDLAAQRWAVIAPKNKDAEPLLEAISPLIKLREQEQGAPATIYRVEPDMTAKDAKLWKDKEYWKEGMLEAELPRYLLVLGDLEEVSLDLQQTMASTAFVGRVHFTDSKGNPDVVAYAKYANKVVDFAKKGTPETAPDMMYFVAQDGTSATRMGEEKLVRPSISALKQVVEKGYLSAASLNEISAETVDDLLEAGASTRPSVLLSVSHGLGAPRRGWKKPEDQWRRQGALVLGRDEVLDAERLEGQPFLPGGMWFCLACFGAGTPRNSAYMGWLQDLADGGAFSGSVEGVRHSLAQHTFVAAMPQAALINAQGPLAIIGHLDLAWTYSFSSVTDLSESRKFPIQSALEAMVGGGRAGIALDNLMVFCREANHFLTTNYELQKEARLHERPDPTNPVEMGHLWMLRNDLGGYVLLGDPAARLPLRQHALSPDQPAVPRTPDIKASPTETPAKAAPDAPAAITEPPAKTPPTAPATATEPPAKAPPTAPAIPTTAEQLALAEALRALTRGDETPRAIADRAGVPLDTLWAAFEAVRALMRGAEAPVAIAARAGVPLDTLWTWFDAYRAPA